MKLKLISLLLVLVMGLQSMAHAGQTIEPPKVKPNGTFLFVVIIAAAVIATIIYQLWKLCQKCLPNSPKPPPDQKKGSDSIPNSQQVQITLNPALSWFNCITNQTPDFMSPDGTNYYSGLMSVNIETSTDMANWTQCGQVTCWLSENYLKVQQLDEIGNSISVATIPN